MPRRTSSLCKRYGEENAESSALSVSPCTASSWEEVRGDVTWIKRTLGWRHDVAKTKLWRGDDQPIKSNKSTFGLEAAFGRPAEALERALDLGAMLRKIEKRTLEPWRKICAVTPNTAETTPETQTKKSWNKETKRKGNPKVIENNRILTTPKHYTITKQNTEHTKRQKWHRAAPE